jgi:hypothetical protein
MINLVLKKQVAKPLGNFISGVNTSHPSSLIFFVQVQVRRTKWGKIIS